MTDGKGTDQNVDSPVRRVRAVYSGHVQGVGFRYTTRGLAQRFGIVGFVRNCPDGTVELVAEGPGDKLEEFLQQIARTFRGYIREADIREWPSSERFDRFEIRY